MKPETRVYPKSCTSLYCGETGSTCETCRFYPALREFKEWRDTHKAVCKNEIWSPLIYTATQ